MGMLQIPKKKSNENVFKQQSFANALGIISLRAKGVDEPFVVGCSFCQGISSGCWGLTNIPLEGVRRATAAPKKVMYMEDEDEEEYQEGDGGEDQGTARCALFSTAQMAAVSKSFFC